MLDRVLPSPPVQQKPVEEERDGDVEATQDREHGHLHAHDSQQRPVGMCASAPQARVWSVTPLSLPQTTSMIPFSTMWSTAHYSAPSIKDSSSATSISSSTSSICRRRGDCTAAAPCTSLNPEFGHNCVPFAHTGDTAASGRAEKRRACTNVDALGAPQA